MGLDITGIGSVASFAQSVVERFFPPKMTDTEKAAGQLALQQMLEARENAVLETQKAVMVAELSQSDAYTKRARPTVVYAGLAFIFMVHVFFPIISWFTKQVLPTVALPDQFWWAWSGVVGIWMVGRTMEKRGETGGIVGQITGNKS